MKKPKVVIASVGPQGNIYAILGAAQRAMRKAHLITAYNNLRDKVLNSKGYTEAIAEIRKVCDLQDTDGKI